MLMMLLGGFIEKSLKITVEIVASLKNSSYIYIINKNAIRYV